MKKMRTTIFNLLLLSAFTLSMSACGNKNKTEDSTEVAEDQNEAKFEDKKIEDDTDFAVEAADAGMFEVEAGKLAQTNASSAKVKEFGQTMIDEHSKANEELKSLAQQKNITLPGAIGEDHQKKYDDLATKKGTDFDKAYTETMVKGHEKVIDAFKKEAEKGNDTDVKMWAAGKLSTLEHHLEMAKQAKDVADNEKK
jgi:putative membrane protein